MKKVWTKIPAMIAMVISLISFGFMIAALIALLTDAPTEHAHGGSFGFWLVGLIVAYGSLIFYFVDAVLSVVKAFMSIHPKFNAVLSIMLIGAIPMVLLVGGGLGIHVYIWNAYYLGIFIMEIVSIVKHVTINSPKGNVI